MQRSRRALLQRRALGKSISRNHLYKFSLSLIVILWGLFSNLWISHSDGHGDGSGAVSVNVSLWDENKLSCYESLAFIENHSSAGACHENQNLAACNEALGSQEMDDATKVGPETMHGSAAAKGQVEVELHSSDGNVVRDNLKIERNGRAVPLGLDEFKNRTIDSKSRSSTGSTGSVIHRMEPGGGEYNYASAAKGAKVLAFNKEAKGASNILGKDKDKYLRNPCSAEEKFVVVELSEETLVDTIKIANFEHYSSKLKEFQLLGSLVYPTDTWAELGNLTAENVKHAQNFSLAVPKWVRYLKMKLRSHYGSEFYCTLSFVEVYGVDAVERMLVDLISVSDNHISPGQTRSEEETMPIQLESSSGQNISIETEPTSTSEGSNTKHESGGINTKQESTISVPDSAEDLRQYQQASRMPGDAVLKILMQKVRSLDLNLSVLERYLEELNSRYRSIFKELDSEIEEKDRLVDKIRSDINDFLESKEDIVRDVREIIAWKTLVSDQLTEIAKDSSILRSEVVKVKEKQMYMERKGIILFLMSMTFGVMAVTMLFIDTVSSVYNRSLKSRKFCCVSSSWLLLLVSCCITIVVLSL